MAYRDLDMDKQTKEHENNKKQFKHLKLEPLLNQIPQKKIFLSSLNHFMKIKCILSKKVWTGTKGNSFKAAERLLV